MKFGIKNKRLLIAEVVLLLASVFVFRSLWHLLDMYSFTNRPLVLILTLAFGMALTIPAYRYIIKNG